MRIELLAAHHNRAKFDCGNQFLNLFLRQHAGQQQRKGLGKTYVAVAENHPEVLGFITVSAGQVAAMQFPPTLKLPRYPIPILRIGRLAVDAHHQGLGIGQDLLAFALRLALEFSRQVGLFAVIVDAKHEKAAAYYQKLGFLPTLDNPLCLYLPLATLKEAVP
jgi:GNAT superfamily N-acetyltransferase